MNNYKKNKSVFIISGEASGDMYAASLITEMLKENPAIYFFGIGGDKMRAVGAEVLVDAKHLAVVGIVEVLSKLKIIYSALNAVKKVIRNTPPDLIILIDYPGFNLRVAKMAKAAGIKVLYYIGPQIWAWRKNRIRLIKQYVDQMAVILPFEADLYERVQIPVSFVGHPIVEQVRPAMTHHEARKKFGITTDHKTLCLMPGSRSGEIKHLLPVILESARLLKKRHSSMQFLLPVAPTVSMTEIMTYLKKYTELNIQILHNQTYDAIQVSDAVITASGTATLEIGLLGTPMVIVYKLASLSYLILKRLARIHYIGLCNIIAESPIVPELIQQDANARKISKEVNRFLDDTEYRVRTQKHLNAMKIKLGDGGASKKVAQMALKLLLSSFVAS